MLTKDTARVEFGYQSEGKEAPVTAFTFSFFFSFFFAFSHCCLHVKYEPITTEIPDFMG